MIKDEVSYQIKKQTVTVEEENQYIQYINGVSYLDTKLFYEQLEVFTPYHKWISRKIQKFELTLGVDYLELLQESTGGRRSTLILLRSELKELLIRSKGVTTKQKDILKLIHNNKTIEFREPKRKEIEFKEHLQGLLKDICCIECQFTVNSFRIDFYIPEMNLAIEYDEKHHEKESNKVRDSIRQNEIMERLGCHFIRVKEGSEIEGLNVIMKFVFKAKGVNKQN